MQHANSYAQIRTNCPECKSKKSKPIFLNQRVTIDTFSSFKAHYYLCDDCNLIYQQPPFRVSDIPESLQEAEVNAQNPFGMSKFIGYLYLVYYSFTRSPILRIRRNCSQQPLRLLDVGCGTGQFLKVAEPHFEVWGVEAAPEACRVARRKFGLQNIICADFKPGLFDRKFDVITIWQTIEHIDYSPRDVIKTAFDLLKPEGMLFIGEIPNLLSIEFDYFKGRCSYLASPVHNFIFTEAYFKNTLPRIGFMHFKIEHNWKNFTLLSQSVLAKIQDGLQMKMPLSLRFLFCALSYPFLLPINVMIAKRKKSATFSVIAYK